MGKDKEISTRSIRISLSHKTSLDELDKLISKFNDCLEELNFMKGE